jgi:hypothetical protein
MSLPRPGEVQERAMTSRSDGTTITYCPIAPWAKKALRSDLSRVSSATIREAEPSRDARRTGVFTEPYTTPVRDTEESNLSVAQDGR